LILVLAADSGCMSRSVAGTAATMPHFQPVETVAPPDWLIRTSTEPWRWKRGPDVPATPASRLISHAHRSRFPFVKTKNSRDLPPSTPQRQCPPTLPGSPLAERQGQDETSSPGTPAPQLRPVGPGRVSRRQVAASGPLPAPRLRHTLSEASRRPLGPRHDPELGVN